VTFTLFPFQKTAVEHHLKVLDQVGASLDGTGCGGGKTIIASEVAKRFALPVGVICPKSVLKKWADTLNTFGVTPLFVLNPEKLRAGNTAWLKKSGKSVKWCIPSGALLIFDEAHMFSATSSLNAKLLMAAQGNYRVLMLSATAAESPLKLKAIGYTLRLFNPSEYWNWVRKMGATDGVFGGLEWDARDPKNKEKMHRLHESIFGPRGYRVSEETLKSQLPELVVSDEPISIAPEDRKKIEELYNEMANPEDIGAVKNLRQRQAIEKVKVPYLAERAQDIISDGGSVVIFLNFHESMDELVQLTKARVIDGRQPLSWRKEARDLFQEGKIQMLIVQIGAGGQSIDLHDTVGDRPRTALLCPQFSGTMEEQAIGRISRVGAKSRALVLRLYVSGTMEKGALGVTNNKRENTRILNEGIMTPKQDAAVVVKTTADDTELRDHAEHSPSSLKEKAKCPGFRNDQSGDKSAANRGTLGHKAVEVENIDIIPLDDPQLRDAAERCLKYLRHLRSKCSGKIEEIRERRYHMHDQFGHIDHLILHDEGKAGELVDHKFAWGKYEADSPQFWAYAVGIFNDHPKLERLTVHVLLPFQNVIDIVTWTRSGDLGDLASKTLGIIERAKRNDPETYQTGVHCTWCDNRATCGKLNALAVTVASKYKADELVLPAEYDPANITDPEQMALAKKVAPIMEAWASKVNARALEMRVQEGIEIPGWELAEKSAPFKIVDAQAAWEVVKAKITPEAFAACAEVKIGELEKAVSRVAERGQMGKAKSELRDALIDANAAKVDGTILYLKKSK
jgi:superfamily II DNA or RNA helicase